LRRVALPAGQPGGEGKVAGGRKVAQRLAALVVDALVRQRAFDMDPRHGVGEPVGDPVRGANGGLARRRHRGIAQRVGGGGRDQREGALHGIRGQCGVTVPGTARDQARRRDGENGADRHRHHAMTIASAGPSQRMTA